MHREQQIHAWLSGVLDSGDFNLEPASGDASFRRYLRVTTEQASFIVMDAPPENEDTTPFCQVAKLLADAELNAPRVLETDPARGFLLLNDMGTIRYVDVLEKEDPDALYTDAIDALVQMQARIPAAAVPDYDAELLLSEMSLFPDWLLGRHLGMSLDSKSHDTLTKTFGHLCQEARSQNQIFVHRDYHARNLMVCPQQNPGILDFQDAVRGPITYDLASLLRDAYVAWSAERTQRWTAHYLDAAGDAGLVSDEGKARFSRDYDLMAAQRHLKVAGIFARLWHRDAKAQYLDHIPLTLRYLEEVCERQPTLEPLRQLLNSWDLRVRVQTKNDELRERCEESAAAFDGPLAP
ncbi:MAG: aminoglycoside phosphotransferase [Gammaproteobacteria bacterium]|nr:MAG: aminoglycoside phosphotransferase [Gammaproteobacteria bacterium]